MSIAPLDDPAYEPKHPPVNGWVPDVVAKWGPRSQLRWFGRFRDQLAYWDPGNYYSETEHHRGGHCDSCMQDAAMGYRDLPDGYCCCYDERMRSET